MTNEDCKTLYGAQVRWCEVVDTDTEDGGYIVLHFEGGAVLYADAPTFYPSQRDLAIADAFTSPDPFSRR